MHDMMDDKIKNLETALSLTIMNIIVMIIVGYSIINNVKLFRSSIRRGEYYNFFLILVALIIFWLAREAIMSESLKKHKEQACKKYYNTKRIKLYKKSMILLLASLMASYYVLLYLI